MSEGTTQRRWLRFSLRTLLASVAVFAILVGWVVSRLKGARDDQQVLADLRPASFTGFDMPTWLPDALKTPFVFNTFFQVDRLEFTALPHLPEDALKRLARLPRIEKLKIDSDTITNDALSQLLAMKRLRVLGISSPQLTDDGLLVLGQIKQLQVLALESPQLSAEGIDRLKRDLPDCRFERFELLDLVPD